MRTKRVVRLAQVSVLLVVTFVSARTVNAQLGKGFITIDAPRSGFFTFANGINDHGNIVGTYYDAKGLGHGFLRTEDGNFTTIDHPGVVTVNGFGTEARGINNAGQIVGDYCAAAPCDGVSVLKGYLLSGYSLTEDQKVVDFDRENFRPVKTPGHINSYVSRINSEGDIVGCEHDTDTAGTMHGFLSDDGKVTRLNVPASMHNGINIHGEIVGFFTDRANKAHGYLLRNGVSRRIDFPGAANTVAWDINNSGEIAGFSGKNGKDTGYILRDGKFRSVVIPGALNTRVFGINSAGDIVGEYDGADKIGHGFLLRAEDAGN